MTLLKKRKKVNKMNKKETNNGKFIGNSGLGLIAILVVACMAASATLPSSYADVLIESNSAILSASLVEYDPAPVEPGSYMTVWIQLSNLGNTAAPRSEE